MIIKEAQKPSFRGAKNKRRNSMHFKAGLLRRKYLKSHGIQLQDAIIVATADYIGVPNATLDEKHFSV
jgi:hypothetical protein